MIKLYIAGLYGNSKPETIKENVECARRASVRLLRMGYAIYCPHTQTEGLESEIPRHVFMQNDFEWIRQCDGIYMLKRWEESPGACDERDLAILIQKTDSSFGIHYEEDDLLPDLR